jgi:hypothetical protein
MGKRFTETNKWSDKWYRALSPSFKHAWNYLTDNCDGAGIIDLDRELANFQIGEAVDWDGFLKSSGDRIHVIARGKWWLPGFIPFQYGTLSPECNAHKPVIAALEKYSLTERVNEPFKYPSGRVQDKDQDKDTDKDKEKEGGVGETKPTPALPPSIRTEAMEEAVKDWLAYKRERRESYKPTGLKAFYGHLSTAVATHGEVAIIERIKKAMASGWKGWDHVDSRGSPNSADDPRGNFNAAHQYLESLKK